MADTSAVLAPVTTANTPAILTSGGDVLAANKTRAAFMVQNLGTNPLFVRYGTGASSSVFHQVLKAATAPDDGTGGATSMEVGTMWVGIVSVAGSSPRFVVTELTA